MLRRGVHIGGSAASVWWTEFWAVQVCAQVRVPSENPGRLGLDTIDFLLTSECSAFATLRIVFLTSSVRVLALFHDRKCPLSPPTRPAKARERHLGSPVPERKPRRRSTCGRVSCAAAGTLVFSGFAVGSFSMSDVHLSRCMTPNRWRRAERRSTLEFVSVDDTEQQMEEDGPGCGGGGGCCGVLAVCLVVALLAFANTALL